MKLTPARASLESEYMFHQIKERVPGKPVYVGSRGSCLAMIQTKFIVQQLRTVFPEVKFVIKEIKTQGDKILDTPLANIGDKGLFVKEIETAMLAGEIDFAVHSMKDLPTEIPSGLTVGCVAAREDPWDVLVSRGNTLDDMPHGACLGTSSLRRSAQLLHYRPDLKLLPLRGNINSRLKKFDEGLTDGIVLAYAGLKRIGEEARIAQVLSEDICLPAVGQGALAIECRQEDEFILNLLLSLEDVPTRISVLAERAFLRKLEGGCQVPIGCYAKVEEGLISITGVVAGLRGEPFLRCNMTESKEDPESVGVKLAEALLDRGARKILDEVRDKYEC